MSVTVQNESATAADAGEVLMERLPASKVGRLLSSWQIGQGDYLKLRDELFTEETVNSIAEEGGPQKRHIRRKDKGVRGKRRRGFREGVSLNDLREKAS